MADFLDEAGEKSSFVKIIYFIIGFVAIGTFVIVALRILLSIIGINTWN